MPGPDLWSLDVADLLAAQLAADATRVVEIDAIGSAWRALMTDPGADTHPVSFTSLDYLNAILDEGLDLNRAVLPLDHHPFAVDGYDADLRLEPAVFSALFETGPELTVRVRRLDTLLSGVPVGLIVLGAHSAKPDTILGAAGTIGQHAPLVAVRDVDDPDQIGAILSALNSIDPAYEAFPDRHGFSADRPTDGAVALFGRPDRLARLDRSVGEMLDRTAFARTGPTVFSLRDQAQMSRDLRRETDPDSIIRPNEFLGTKGFYALESDERSVWRWNGVDGSSSILVEVRVPGTYSVELMLFDEMAGARSDQDYVAINGRRMAVTHRKRSLMIESVPLKRRALIDIDCAGRAQHEKDLRHLSIAVSGLRLRRAPYGDIGAGHGAARPARSSVSR